MDAQTLAEHLKDPDVLTQLLAGHVPPYSLGVTSDPDDAAHSAISLRISSADTSHVPKTIRLGDEEVSVIVCGNFRGPVLYGRR